MNDIRTKKKECKELINAINSNVNLNEWMNKEVQNLLPNDISYLLSRDV